jgi:hypothetical protein
MQQEKTEREFPDPTIPEIKPEEPQKQTDIPTRPEIHPENDPIPPLPPDLPPTQ